MKVAVVGLGRMGVEVARRIEKSDHELVVSNRTPEKAAEFVDRGATLASTPAEAFGLADATITLLADGATVKSIAMGSNGLFEAPNARGKTLIEMSTIDVDDSAEIARAAEHADVAYLRAPVSGNPSVVAAGNLAIMVSGDEAAFEDVRPLLEVVGPRLFYFGGKEEARVMKLALNLMIGGTAELLAEALVLGEANGLDRAEMLEVIGGSAAGSRFVGYKTQPLIEEDYSSTFSAKLMAKDLDLVFACATDSGVTVPVAALTRQLMHECISDGMGDLDFSVVLPRLEKQAGLRDSLPTATE
jgi:3-hydroxyisobutyrate dehydrogenase-like beta-hydroxyacid dehydrogenase